MKDFIARLLEARRQSPKQQELMQKGRYEDDVIEAFGGTNEYDQYQQRNPDPTGGKNVIGHLLQRLLNIRGN